MGKTQSLDATDLLKTTKPKAASKQRGEVDPAVLLQFKVPHSFAKEFKLAALNEDMRLNQLFRACFETYKKAK